MILQPLARRVRSFAGWVALRVASGANGSLRSLSAPDATLVPPFTLFRARAPVLAPNAPAFPDAPRLGFPDETVSLRHSRTRPPRRSLSSGSLPTTGCDGQ